MVEWIELDGSQGEGGGQILRTALALSMVTGKPFHLRSVRARRPRPGLQRQHLTAVLAAAQISGAEVQGGQLHSGELTFRPGKVEAGEYHFSVGTAGSTTLVLQTILPPLMLAEGNSQLVLEGGTHNPHAPPVDFLQRAFLPLLCRMGPRVEVLLHAWGFYPAGGGRLSVTIEPAARLQRLDLLSATPPQVVRAVAVVARLPRHIAERELDELRRLLRLPSERCKILVVENSASPGNVLLVECSSADVTEVFAGFGQRGVRAEQVARDVARDVQRYLRAVVPVGPYLADQLLLPMALAGGGAFRTVEPTLHTLTNIEVIQRFLPVHIWRQQESRDGWKIGIDPAD
jgi:RNA 3'-terminal phosphate cyclase (ATP)